MAFPQIPKPVKLITAVLYSDEQRLLQAKDLLKESFGSIDYISPCFPFNMTDYYKSEMGSPIFRLFYAFENLVLPNTLAAVKQKTNTLEQKLKIAEKRHVNIDPGYLDVDKFVLASAKYKGTKIYLADGIWADMTLQYQKGQYVPFEWSFPDYSSGIYNDVFLTIRALYKKQLRHEYQR